MRPVVAEKLTPSFDRNAANRFAQVQRARPDRHAPEHARALPSTLQQGCEAWARMQGPACRAHSFRANGLQRHCKFPDPTCTTHCSTPQ